MQNIETGTLEKQEAEEPSKEPKLEEKKELEGETAIVQNQDAHEKPDSPKIEISQPQENVKEEPIKPEEGSKEPVQEAQGVINQPSTKSAEKLPDVNPDTSKEQPVVKSEQELPVPKPATTQSKDPSPKGSAEKVKPKQELTPETPQPEKPKTFFLSLQDLSKWDKKMKALESKLKKAEEELEGLKKQKVELAQHLKGIGTVQNAEKEALKDSEKKTKEKFEMLEQKNKSLVDMLDQAEASNHQSVGKGKEIDTQREILKKQLQEKVNEVEELKERYRKEFLLEKELNKLRTDVNQTHSKMERIEASIVQLRRKEVETAKRKEAEKLDQEAIESMKTEIQKFQEESKILDQELSKLRSEAVEHTQQTLLLSAQVEDLQLKEKMHETELEFETKSTRDEIVHYKKTQAGKDLKLKQLERENEEMKKRVSSQEAEIAVIANQLRAASQTTAKVTGINKRSDKSDMKLIEGLLQDKKELKVEVDKFSRETGRLDVIIKDLEENIEMRKKSIQLLIGRYSELEMVDKLAAAQILREDTSLAGVESLPRMSNAEIKRLMENVILQNIYLKQRIPKLESQLECLDIS